MKALSFCETCKLAKENICMYDRENMPRSYVATNHFLNNGGQLCSQNVWKRQARGYNIGEAWKNELQKIRRLLPGSNFLAKEMI